MIDLQANKDKFIEIYKGEIHREGADKLLDWIINKTDFFEMPFTGKYTLSCKGGGCLHAINTYHCMYDLLNKYRAIDPNYLLDPKDCVEPRRTEAIAEIDEAVAITSLLHDLGNANSWLETMKNVKENGKWVAKPGYEWNEDFAYGHGAKAVFIIQSYMRLYIDEAQAIRFHAQGREIPYNNNFEDIFYSVYETNGLAALLGVAVNEASNVADKLIWQQIQGQI